MKNPPIIIINHHEESKFEKECRDMIEAGYVLKACSCGFVNSETYDFHPIYQAIMERKL